MSAEVERVLGEIKALTPEERQQIRAALETMLTDMPGPQMTEEEFERHLLAKGIISSIPPRNTDYTAHRDFKPIEILDGKPVSETIIEERR
ncbi:MAG TPA: hypothetical protein VGO91_09875 [Pyrinomonadaceae bacterium]|jgi:hypothetical protein|nr:hypothetical protein [Pyrinomonadaceae bacterium]